MSSNVIRDSLRDPVNVILITSGSRGQRLLFRYPFKDGTTSSTPPLTPVENDPPDDTSTEAKNPYKVVKEDTQSTPKEQGIIINKCLFGYEDSLLANMLAPKSILNSNFELKIGHVTFAGFPVQIDDDEDDMFNAHGEEEGRNEEFTINMVHVVVAFKSTINDASIFDNHSNISKMMGMALRHEEKR